jgi:hypothetical protein
MTIPTTFVPKGDSAPALAGLSLRVSPDAPGGGYERFAQALFAGLAGETRVDRAQSTAYLTAYPSCSNGNSAEEIVKKF